MEDIEVVLLPMQTSWPMMSIHTKQIHIHSKDYLLSFTHTTTGLFFIQLRKTGQKTVLLD